MLNYKIQKINNFAEKGYLVDDKIVITHTGQIFISYGCEDDVEVIDPKYFSLREHMEDIGMISIN